MEGPTGGRPTCRQESIREGCKVISKVGMPYDVEMGELGERCKHGGEFGYEKSMIITVVHAGEEPRRYSGLYELLKPLPTLSCESWLEPGSLTLKEGVEIH